MTALQLVASVYLILLATLALFGLHRLYLVALSSRARPASPIPAPAICPIVTVQLPVYNERYVVGRLIAAAGRLRHPLDKLQIQVLDDSDDDTATVAAEAVTALRQRGIEVEHLRRPHRRGYKAGALAHGLERARGEFICVFDADFLPPADFLERTLGAFADPGVGMVQARWEHLNAEASMLTRVQAMMLDAHFGIEHRARQHAGRFFNFNGTAGVWRRAAIEDSGGWHEDTLTEDLDLSYRAQLRGWRFRYLDDVRAAAELPAAIGAFQGQQRRWTQGAMQTAHKLLGEVWRSALPLGVKLEATAHLGANFTYPLMLALSVVAPVALWARHGEAVWSPPGWLEGVLLALATGSVSVFFVASAAARGGSVWRTLSRLPWVMCLGAGMAVNNSMAIWRALRGQATAFARTPKLGARGLLRYRGDGALALDGVLVTEAAMAVWSLVALAVAILDGNWWSLPLISLFLVGYGQVAGLSLRDRWRARRAEDSHGH